MGIVEGGKLALLAGAGPMGLGSLAYALCCDRRHGHPHRRTGQLRRNNAEPAQDSRRKKLIYTHNSMPLTAIADFRAKAADDPRFAGLADICEANRNLWCPKAEEYLLANWR